MTKFKWFVAGTALFGLMVASAFAGAVAAQRLSIRETTTDSLANNDVTLVIDTTAGNKTLTLPAAPSDGRVLIIRKESASNTLTIARNGNLIDGAASNMALTGDGDTVTLQYNLTTTGWWMTSRISTAAGSGTVTSVALTTPAELSVAGSPVTTAGTLAATWASDSGPKFIGTPVGGGAGAYAGRALVLGDIPDLSTLYTDFGTLSESGDAPPPETFTISQLTDAGLLKRNGTAIDTIAQSALIAGKATILETARTINGTSFDGSANITVTAAADTLTGTSLAAGVTTSSLGSVGTIASGTWQGTAVAGAFGGTGVANTSKTITLGGNLTTSGAFNTTLTVTADSNVTLPTTGTLATLAGSEAITNKTIGRFNYGESTTGNDTYVITLSPAPAAYTTGMFIIFKAGTANTGTASINVNGLGAKTIVKRAASTLANGDIPINALALIIYDGTTFTLVNPVVN